MTEWWTYGLSDFLMFSPEAYWRLVARHNADAWPAQLLAGAVPAALLLMLRNGSAAGARAVLLLFALAWAWLGLAFYWQHYSEIFLGAPWIAGACGVQSLVLAATALLPLRNCPTALRSPGAALLAAALCYPLLAPLTGHPWSESEVFAFMPEPTALATLGALSGLAQVPGAARLAGSVLPVLSLLLGAATRWLIA